MNVRERNMSQISSTFSQNWIVHQIDVDNAFLNMYLTEEVFMEKPTGFEQSNKLCKLYTNLGLCLVGVINPHLLDLPLVTQLISWFM